MKKKLCKSNINNQCFVSPLQNYVLCCRTNRHTAVLLENPPNFPPLSLSLTLSFPHSFSFSLTILSRTSVIYGCLFLFFLFRFTLNVFFPGSFSCISLSFSFFYFAFHSFPGSTTRISYYVITRKMSCVEGNS